MPQSVKIPVRALVEYVYRSGSIVSGFKTTSSLIKGTKAHKTIQKTYGESDSAEVFFQMTYAYEEIDYTVEGRCDGLLFDEDLVTIDEIKSTAKPLDDIKEDSYPVHWAQAKCYAYMYLKKEGEEKIKVQLTYVHVESGEQKRFQETCTFDELEAFMLHLIKSYAPYAKLRYKNLQRRKESIRELSFPFDHYRNGQRNFAGAVYKTIADKKTLFANAPTGTGKTISTLFPAVKAMGEEKADKIFYLTAKTLNRKNAEEAFQLMSEKGLFFQSVTITAKDKVCFKEETRCDPDYCEFAEGYFDRINDAVLDILKNETVMNREVISHYAKKHRVCPFEFSIDLAYAVDSVICDYNYVFDPRVSFKRLFEEQKKQTVLLMDEAHNLVDRARSMYSAELQKSMFLQLSRAYKGKNEKLRGAIKAINDEMLKLKKEHGEKQVAVKELPLDLISSLDDFLVQAEKLLAGGESDEQLLEAYFSALQMVKISDFYDERFVTFIDVFKSEVVVRLFCMDPSQLLFQTGKKYGSRIFFSATLSPLSYFMEMLGGGEEDYVIRMPSPYEKEQLDVFIQPLSTRFKDRDKTIEPITEMLIDLVDKRPGNYLVFFPSYRYMTDVVDRLLEEELAFHPLIQHPSMSEEEREEFLANFDQAGDRSLVGFAVMGGIFSEGIDLKGDRLTGAVIIGVGLPQVGLERDTMKDYFQSTGKNGYDFAYVYPGMNKVLQAGGRVIRSEEDQGTLVLVDDRFLSRKYVEMLPEEWRNFVVLKR
ncbi:ATP-dependent DNA helicase [Fictibacillus phosphorivorans]|uniref:ATP-dependent DNA helicase n=1 Tax=Fictibacillus phosphorivorans TaxID=1221500 RepID=UPI00203D0A8D|nr:ATP-dependent DNA helicase [Fictibacillus phosphorivorans]MCM3717323.1 ATP-dependent DNA helicase [Fictibacillus phosphorivorans]MCM3775018.1 ATP-dependent DNA helicase [Fictibacillus phosphorivorans]